MRYLLIVGAAVAFGWFVLGPGGLAWVAGFSVGLRTVLAVLLFLFTLWACLRAAFRPAVPDLLERERLREPTDPALYASHGLGPLEPSANGRELYVDLVKRAVANVLYEDPPAWFYDHTKRAEPAKGFDLGRRARGEDAPSAAHSMIGLRRLDSLEACLATVLRDRVPGDLVEAGVFRGGATIFMRAFLRAHGVQDRKVWACDSFVAGERQAPGWIARAVAAVVLPFLQALAAIPNRAWRRRLFQWHQRQSSSGFPDCDTPADDLVDFLMWRVTHPDPIRTRKAAGLDDVRSHFARYGLLDDRVVFLQGFFADTLPEAPIEKIALMRLDGDIYESTRDAIVHLYPKLSPGGFCVVDDYHAFEDCRRAVDEYRAENGIDDELVPIDNIAVYWRRS